MSSSLRILKDNEIKDILKNVSKIHYLELYSTLKNSKINKKATSKDLNEIKKNIKEFLKKKNIPRFLSKDELSEIVEVIPKIPSPVLDISLSNQKQIQGKIKERLSLLKFSIVDGTIEKIKNIIYEQFLRSLSEPGDSVGIMSAMAISEPLTQASLDDVHKTGTKKGESETLGNIKELFNLKINRKSDNCIVHFKNKNLTREEIKLLERIFKGISVKTLIHKTELLEEINKKDKIWYDNYKLCTNTDFEYTNGKFLRIYLNLTKCYKFGIMINDVVSVIEKNTQTSQIPNSVTCISSPSFMGIIDIYGNDDFIENSVIKFLNTGEKLPKCISKKSKFKKVKKEISYVDMKSIFLKVIIEECFEYMMIKGVEGIEEIQIPTPVDMLKSFDETNNIRSSVLEKFDIEDIDRIWKIDIKTNFIYSYGIDINKIILLLESVNIEIIEKNDFEFFVLMSKERKELYFDSDSDKILTRYEINEEGLFYDNKEQRLSLEKYGPKKLIGNWMDFYKEEIRIKTNKKVKDGITTTELPNYPDTYRYGYYCYAIIEGKNIIKNLINHKLVDSRFTYPNNPVEVFDLFGIEAARYYLLTRYNMNEEMAKLNPSHPELLVDFQTSMGKLLPLTHAGVSKQGNNTLTSAAFQQQMETFGKAAAFGSKDDIKGISSCIMTGTRCENGTGLSKVIFNKEYLENEENKVVIQKPVEPVKMEQGDDEGRGEGSLGQLPADRRCFSQGELVIKDSEDEDEGSPTMLITEGKLPNLCPKEDIPEPSRMKIPEVIKIIIDTEILSFGESDSEDFSNDLDLTQIEVIPQNPGEFQDDNFLDFKL